MNQQMINDIKTRLFATKSEYKILSKENLTKFHLTCENSCNESFWGLDLGDNLFLIYNNILEWLPNRTCGRVGYHIGCEMDSAKSVELFKQCHQAYYEEYK